ncbi:HERC2 [Symbiodinium sp. CCMP2456]|nr:HERC2 [Symbiodinium sp. CCMP2456]
MVAASNLPAPLTDGELIQSASLSDVPDAESLAAWLLDKGLDTADWGKDNTKGVSKFWKEIKLNEAALELWRAADGSLIPVRTTHVLRAKVTSPDRYERGIFLFNTWQQYGDGRTRTRNGLLSEKLTTDEMPLEENLHEVCRRAVTEEEMQRVVESTMKIGLGRPAPEYDPNYTCPLEVVNEHFVDHIIELEKSKSYPGLLTMYHLYTVDIVCTGLPLTDLNTLEFEHPDKDGKRKLKYIHAWVWLEWPQIQRYLFEGSELKETKRKGSFANAGALTTWLSQFDLRMEKWGKGTLKSVEALFKEIENEDSLLELWGRHDGVPMLMRVTHVLQLRVTSPEPSLKGTEISIWEYKERQSPRLQKAYEELLNGKRRVTHTLPAMKLTLKLDFGLNEFAFFTAQPHESAGRRKDMPYDEEKFRASAAALATGFAIKLQLVEVTEQLNHVVDIHYRITPSTSLRDSEPSGVQLHEVHFVEQRHDVEESPSYRGLFTMYHLYCMEAECSGLPISDFASMDLKDGNIYSLKGWSWSSAQRVMDIMRHRSLVIEREQAAAHAKWRDAGQTCLDCVGRRHGAYVQGLLELTYYRIYRRTTMRKGTWGVLVGPVLSIAVRGRLAS